MSTGDIGQLLTEVRNLISSDQLGQAIKKVEDHFKGGDPIIQNDLVSFRLRHTQVVKKDMMGGLTDEMETVQLTNIANDLLKYISHLSSSSFETRALPDPPGLKSPITSNKPNMRELRNVLSKLFEDLNDVRMIVDDAGLKSGNLNLTGTVKFAWREVLKEAEKTNKLRDVIEAALGEYPEDEALNRILNGMSHGSNGGGTEEPVSPVSPPSPSPRQPKTNTKKIYFSYGWGDKREEGVSREQVVNELYDSLKNDGFNVIRDKYNLGWGGSISQFEKEIGEGDLTLVFLSDKYVRSNHCMHELLRIYRHNRSDRDLFTQAILPIAVQRVNLSDSDSLDVYYKHWESESDRCKESIRKYPGKKNPKCDRILEINDNFDDLAAIVSDLNSSTVSLLSQNDFSLVKETIIKRLG